MELFRKIKYLSILVVSILIAIMLFSWKKERRNITQFIFHLASAILFGLLIKYLINSSIDVYITNYEEIGLILFLMITSIYFKEALDYTVTIKEITNNYLKAIYFLMLVVQVVFILMNINTSTNLFLVACISVVYFFSNNKNKENNLNVQSDDNDISDRPVSSFDKLFPTRKKECLIIYDYLEELDTDDPFAIAINAEWGEGKTSFINGLQEKMDQDKNYKTNVIFVQPMILDNREKLLRYVFGQLEAILIKNNIYTGK